MMASRPHPTIDKMIRVNYAGEHAAVRMCAGIASAAGLTEDIEVVVAYTTFELSDTIVLPFTAACTKEGKEAC